MRTKIGVWYFCRILVTTVVNLCFLTTAARVDAQESDDASAKSSSATVTADLTQLTEKLLPSIVEIHQLGRDGEDRALGTGFVISSDGLVATNFHVIGQTRPLRVMTQDRQSFRVLGIHASEPDLDLAVLRIEKNALPVIQRADSDETKPGQAVVAIGHPQGRRFSVVSGIVSSRMKVEDRSLLQLAIPIFQGNSGGPVVDLQGRAVGILALKSSDTVGYAIPINALRPMLDRPNPVSMERWLTLQRLDTDVWQPVFGGEWKQKAARVFASGPGSGFGGRTLCLHKPTVPSGVLEISVDVRLGDESGAAGLTLFSDGKNRHYGFYPSNGAIRFSRFDGPSVYTWNVVREVASDAYKRGEWNSLRVRIDGDDFSCFVNNTLIIDESDGKYRSGQMGLCSFRGSNAQFRNFRVRNVTAPAAGVLSALADFETRLKELPKREKQLISVRELSLDEFINDAGVVPELLEDRAQAFEQQAAALRTLNTRIRRRRAQLALKTELAQEPEQINLMRASLLIAQLDNAQIDVDVYLRTFKRMAGELGDSLPDNATEAQRIERLNAFLFEENGFHGNRLEYNARSNSYMNDVLFDRRGLPITLSVLYMELARQIDLRVVGVGLPGHFVVRHEPNHVKKQSPPEVAVADDKTANQDAADRKQTEDNTAAKSAGKPAEKPTEQIPAGQFIDVFAGGKFLSIDDAKRMCREATGRFDSVWLRTQTSPEIIERMLRNLISIAESANDVDRLLGYMETLVILFPEEPEFRAKRIDLFARRGQFASAIRDVDWFMQNKPDGIDLEKLSQFRAVLEQQLTP